MTPNYRLLWADDEIDLLKPHIMFLEKKGYSVETANNGADAIELVATNPFHLIILDENMPGLTGLETLQRIKEIAPHIPVIMITKSEEEDIMDQAVGSKISDYLIKPVNPNQILLSIKKNLHSEQLVSEQSTTDYRQQFMEISMMINNASSFNEWTELFRRLSFWEIELQNRGTDLSQMLEMQKNEANAAFCKFVIRHYRNWIDRDNPDAPVMSPDLFKHSIFPLLDQNKKVFFIVIDNFRYDQWLTIRPLLADVFNFNEKIYCSILPTATQYARNSIFSGLMPLEIARLFPDLWVDEDEDEGKNLNEEPLIATHFQRYRRQCRFSYNKINSSAAAEKMLRNFSDLLNNQLNVVVFNFIDMLSHARTESRMIRELAGNNAAYRSLTESWFRHSPALEFFRRIAEEGHTIVLATDHGTIRVDNPVKVVGEKSTNTNLRYKLGRNLAYNPKQVYEIKRPEQYGLPSPQVSTTYIFATNRQFFAYPNNYNQYVQRYDGTFQHGGISMDEMLVPLVTLTPKE